MDTNFSSIPSKLCYIAPYCHILKNYGFDISEEYLMGISKGLTFEYCYIHNNMQVKTPQTIYDWISIVGSKSNISKAIADRFGIKFYEKTIMDKEFIIDLCKEELRQNRFVIVFLDVYFLKYHPQYKNTHGQTNVIIYKWNKDNKCFYFYDSHVSTIPVTTYSGCLTEDELLEALIIGENPYNGREVGLVLNRYMREPAEIDIYKKIQANAIEMLNPHTPYCGVAGMLTLAEQIEKWLEFWSSDCILNVLRKGYHHVAGRGGPAISREVYTDFLSKYVDSGICKIDIDTVKQGFIKSSTKWTSLGVKFFRSSIKFKDSNLLDISQCLREIARLEKVLFEQLSMIV